MIVLMVIVNLHYHFGNRIIGELTMRCIKSNHTTVSIKGKYNSMLNSF